VCYTRQTMMITSFSHPDHLSRPDRELLDAILQQAHQHFGDRLISVYVLGSVGRGQAQPGHSDLDLDLVLADAPSTIDKSWRDQYSQDLQQAHPRFCKIDLGLTPITALQAVQNQRLRFIFATDGLCYWGPDIRPTTEIWEPGPQLAWMLNSHYRWARSETQRALTTPTASEQADAQHIPDYVRWYAKQLLRLGLGLAMHQQPVYTRQVAEMATLVTAVCPELAAQMASAWSQYQYPPSQQEEALAWLATTEPLYLAAIQAFAAQ
jgi:predicted nucleotidyltransferase